jgi:hypothetical protein
MEVESPSMSEPKKKKAKGHTKSTISKRPRTRARPGYTSAKELKLAKQYFEHLDNLQREANAKFEAFVDAHRHLPCIERAGEWLKFVLSIDEVDFGDQEATIYLLSRGNGCTEYIQNIKDRWLKYELREIEKCSEGRASVTMKLDGGSRQVGQTKYVGGMSLAEARKIEDRSEFELRDFWWGSRYQEQTIDATMLRTVEWCGIGGFEPWWKRLARRTTRDFLEGGLDPGLLVYWLFGMSRSPLAIKMMPRAMNLALENMELVRIGSRPWTVWDPNTRRKGKPTEFVYQEYEHLAWASSLIFVNYRLRRPDERSGDLLDDAAGLLQKYQRKDGSWAYFSHDKESSIEATAMATHALAFHRPVGWERNVAGAAAFLNDAQKEAGYWEDSSCPDSIYLTVLVLDALELSSGGKRVTFERPSKLLRSSAAKVARELRVALSFPGEAREMVEPVAEKLLVKLGKGKVFYDNYFKSRLARPNLDVFLQSVYRDKSDLVVVWLSSDYARKEWCCNVEWPAIRDAIKQRRGDDVMFLSLDEGKPEGFLSNYGYADLKGMSTDEIAELILSRLEDHTHTG